MSLSDFEIGKIAEIVAGKSGAKLDAKALRQVVDRVVDALKEQQANPDIRGVTCDVSRSPKADISPAQQAMLSKPSVGGPPFTVGDKDPTINGGPPGQRQDHKDPDLQGTADVGQRRPTSQDTGGPQLAVGSESKSVPSQLQPPDEAMITGQGGLYEQIEKSDKTRVIIAAFGKDRPGVGAALTAVLAEHNCSIEDISQTLLQDFFSMIMIVNIEGSTVDFATLVERLKATEARLGMKVYVMHEDTFRYMHRI